MPGTRPGMTSFGRRVPASHDNLLQRLAGMLRHHRRDADRDRDHWHGDAECNDSARPAPEIVSRITIIYSLKLAAEPPVAPGNDEAV